MRPATARIPRAGSGRGDPQTAEKLAARLGKEGFETPREQFVYSRNRPIARVLALIWGLKERSVFAAMQRDKAKGFDWQKARREHIQAVARGVAEATQQQVEEESADVAAVYLQCTSIAVARCMGAITGAGIRDTHVIMRTLKECYDLEDRISGRKAISEIYDKRRAENAWFVSVIKRHVRDPETLRKLAEELSIRRAVLEMREGEELGELVDGDDDPVGRAGAALDRADGIEVKDVSPGAPDIQKKGAPKRLKGASDAKR